jgi:hypothetical protein
MKSQTRNRFPSAILGASLLIVVASGFANSRPQFQPVVAVANSGALAHRPKKNPKLSTQLADLARAVPQRGTALVPGERVTAPPGFSIAKLPKSARDAIKAGQMKVSDKGEVQVYIEVNQITPENLAQLRSWGVTIQILGEPKPDKKKGEVLSAVPTVQGMLPIEMVNEVAALPFVRYIRLPDYGFTNTGSVDSQGDAILQADVARSQFGVDGTGIRVGVISDGIGGIFATGCTSCGPSSATPSPIASGDLPSATGTRNSSGILTSVSGGITAQSFRADGNLEACLGGTCDTSGNVGAEGTAMLEIVHDLAPGSQLYFANFDTGLSFEQAVNYLAANTDISVDDIGFTGLPPYDGTDPVSTNTATDLNTSTNPIRGYFTAVANQVFDHWAEPWTDSGTNATLSCPASLGGTSEPGDVQLFQATASTIDSNHNGPSVINNLALPNGDTLSVILTWNDPISGSSNDYDLYLYQIQLGSLVAPLACSVNPQTGTQPPVEFLSYTNTSGAVQTVGIVIQNVNNAAAARDFDMFVAGIGNGNDIDYYTPSGSVPAESDAGGSPVSVVSVGAIDQTQCTSTGNCTGLVEPYSSQGPTEATPQAAARMKPDVTATDDVTVTGAGGFGFNGPNGSAPGGCAIGETPCYFPGTSAAAPHVAAIAALVLQAAPCLLSSSTVNTPATARTNLRNFITSTAVPLPGVSQAVPNNIEGFGLVNALAAVTATLPAANAGASQTVNATSANGASVTLSGSGTDPDSCPLTLSWSGSCGTASGESASMMCPIGNDTETLTVSNGGVTTSLPTSTLQIAVTDFTVASVQPSASVSPGQSASYTINVGSSFGAFTNPVSLACSGLPSLSSCSFSSPSVTPGPGSASSTLTISTTAPSSVFPMFSPRSPRAPFFALWFGLLFMFALAAIIAKKSGRRLAAELAFAALLICLVSPIVACGGGNGPKNPGTPAGTYTVNVTGTSNQLQHSTSVTLTVQ